MCQGNDPTCPHFTLHRQKLMEDLSHERRAFLKSAFVATGGAATLGTGGGLISSAAAQTTAPRATGTKPAHHYLPATADTVHWAISASS
jgi:hypothetical protein